MTVNLEIPKKQQVENAAKIAVAALGAVVVARVIGNIADRVHEHRQDKEIKKLKKQIAEQDERIANLEEEIERLQKTSK